MISTRPKQSGLIPGEIRKAGLRDLWTVYEAHAEEVMAATREAASRHASLANLTSATSPAENDRSDPLLRAALLEGEWDPYVAHLGEQGARYAQAGLEFEAWFTVVRAFRNSMHSLLFQTFAGQQARLVEAVAALSDFSDITLETITQEYLRERETTIGQQQEAIRELSTPVLPVREGLLVLPIIGVLDSDRARQLTEQLLDAIREQRARAVVIDATGVPAVDSAVANHLLQTVQAARLLGARAIVTGLSTANAQILVRIGVSLTGLETAGDLRDGIETAERWLSRVT